jgi:hypothetical protein
MNAHRVLALLFLATLALGPSLRAQPNAKWGQLPLIQDGKIDGNWVQIGHGGWEVDDGALRAKPDSKGIGLLVYKPQQFGDCQIKVVFRAKDTNCNSGVYVRIGDGILSQTNSPGAANQLDAKGQPTADSVEQLKASSEREEGPWYAVHRGYEIQIDSSWGSPDATEYNGTGAVYSMSKSSGIFTDIRNWVTMVITLSDEHILVDIDGKRVSSFDPSTDTPPARAIWYEPKREPKRPKTGYIGLQTHGVNDIVWFKEVSVRTLKR